MNSRRNRCGLALVPLRFKLRMPRPAQLRRARVSFEADMPQLGMSAVFRGVEEIDRSGSGNDLVLDSRRLGYPAACRAARRTEIGAAARRAAKLA